MAILPIAVARVSDQLRSSVALSTIAKTQSDLLTLQNEISTGKRVNTPSDDPAAAVVIQQLNKTLQQRTAYSTNLQNATSQLGQVDSSLGDLTDVLQQAQTIASQNVGSDTSPSQRQAAAAVIDTLISRAEAVGNVQLNGVYVFGGDRSNSAPFVNSNGAIKYVGSSNVLQNNFDEATTSPFMVDGEKVFGSLTTQVAGTVNLAPALAADTRLSDLGGATGDGIAAGSIRISDGTTTAAVDLSKADTIGDVVNAINAAGVSGVTAALGTDGIQLSGGGDITVNEVSGHTAANLGILTPTSTGPGNPVAGQSLNAKVTNLTKLSQLNGGAGIDLSGITIQNGATTTPLAFSGDTTVEDLLNTVNGSKAGVLARINAAGSGIDIVNPTQGTSLTISENGGTTAAQLGVRNFTAQTEISSLNGGKGIGTAPGADIQITRSDGSNFSIDTDGLHTTQDVIDAINTADGGGGVTASFATGTNGITLTDSTGGGGTLTVTALNGSTSAKDLGLLKPAVGNTITGSDVNPVVSTGIFANLQALRTALNNNDQNAITDAAQGLTADHDRVVLIRGEAGAQTQALQARQTQIGDENLATKTLLSNLQDTDVTTAISQYTLLQTQLQASYRLTAISSNQSLLDFLQ